MKIKLFVTALAASLALSAPAYAGDDPCAGLKGKDKKECIKKQKELANTSPFVPSELGAKFADWDAEDKNPFNTDAYSVRTNPSGFADVDAYLGKVWRAQAIVAASKYTVDQVAAGNADAIALVPDLVPLMKELPDLVTGLKDEGPALVQKLPDILQGADAMKIPKIGGSITSAAAAAVAAGADVPKLLESLGNLAKDPSAAAGAATDMAAEAATEAAGEAAGDAVEGATEAAGDAVEGAKDAVEAATGGE